MSTRRLTDALAASLLAGLFSISFALGYVWLQGVDAAPGYVLTCAALTLAAAVLTALPASLTRHARSVGLASWAAVSGTLLLSPLSGLALGLLVFAILSVAGAERRSRLDVALTVATSLAVGCTLWPEFAGRIWPFVGRPNLVQLSQVGVAGAVLAVLMHSGARAGRRLRLATPRAAFVLVLGLATASAIAAPRTPGDGVDGAPRDAAPERASVIVLVLDTVRADHLSVYGYERDTTPELARFVRESERAVVYPFAYAPATWTLPSHTSLLTGELASQHGIHERTMFQDGQVMANALHARETLAESLQEVGYRTGAVVANPWLEHVEGLDRGFDRFERPPSPVPLPLVGEELRQILAPAWFADQTSVHAPAASINRGILRFVEQCDPDPCFVMANYMEAHAPWRPPHPYAGTFSSSRAEGPPHLGLSAPQLEVLKARYDESILALDAALGDLLDELETRGVLDEAWLVITADHGEAFGEHGVTEHGTTVYNENTRIPLIVQPPRGVTLPRVKSAVSLIDVTATVAAVAGAGPLGQGDDLRQPVDPDRPVAIEFFGLPHKMARHGALAGEPARSVVRGVDKVVEHAGRREFYQLDNDPAERRNLAAARPATTRRLAALLPEPAAAEERTAERGLLHLSASQEQALRILGYIE